MTAPVGSVSLPEVRVMSKSLFSVLLLALLASTGHCAFAANSDEPLVVFAAASLADALQKVSEEYTQATGTRVKLSFAASSALARQIESGAGADVFVSADEEWMDYLEERKLIVRSSRQDLLGNRLILIAPRDSKVMIELGPAARLLEALGNRGRIATGDPDSVPVGKYAKAALTSLGLWDSLQSRLIRADNVRVALMFVARGEAPLGIVYATDARAEPKVRSIDAFPASAYPRITYPVAATCGAKPAAKSFLDFLRGASARAIFENAGFTVLGSESTAKAEECGGFRFDVSRELQLLRGPTESLAAGVAAASGGKVTEGRAYRVTLEPQRTVHFALKPEKPTVAEGSFAGLATYTAAKDGNLRVSLSEAAWIEGLADGKPLTSTSHSGGHNCKALRKAVQFDVKPNQSIVLELSGSATPHVNLLITQ